jgi:hypothetical protein
MMPWSRRLSLLIVVLSLAYAAASVAIESGNMSDSRTAEAMALMTAFAERTGLTSARPQQRYLWTDAFAVCNLLGLARETGERGYIELALRLVERVHHTLGRHRDDDPRGGWLSGLSQQFGAAHPTRGGLRIGKELPERRPGEPFDERLEWERDGQYFHYLTKWMLALDLVTRFTGQPQFNLWARELAETAYHAFTYQPSPAHAPRMYWKMSIDLTRALVPSMGQHDPLDGYITYVQLRATAAGLPESAGGPSLEAETHQLSEMLPAREWATADPLGLGGLLVDAYRVQPLMGQGAMPDDGLLETLLSASLDGLRYYARSGDLDLSADHRLAFRELGLSIGLQAVRLMRQADDGDAGGPSLSPGVRARIQALMEYAPLAHEIESFWRDPAHRRGRTWSEHRDINEVMLATSLAPDGFLAGPQAPAASPPDR